MRQTLSTAFAVALALSSFDALAQQPAPKPPGTGTDMELDPDAKPPEEEKKEAAPLPPSEEGAWGVGGAEEEGRFAPGKKKDTVVEEKEPTAEELGPPGAFGADVVLGFGSIRDVKNDTDPTDIFVASFLFGGRYRFGKMFSLGLRFPFSTGNTEGPNAVTFKSFALGNAELSARLTFQATPRIRIPVGVAFDLPFASGDQFPGATEQGSEAQALVAQSAIWSRGFEEYALFASKRFGLVPMAGIEYAKGPLRIVGGTKFEGMFKTGGNDPPTAIPGQPQGRIHDPAFNWVTGGGGSYDFFGGKLSPSLRTWLAVARPPVSAGVADYPGARWVAEIGANSRVAFSEKSQMGVVGGIGFIFPIAGNLGGNASATGLRLNAALVF